MKETKAQREERKAMYIARVMSKNHGTMDEEELYKEAEEKFEKENENIS